MLQRLGNPERIGEILRNPLQAAGNPDFFALAAVGGELSHIPDGPELILNPVDIITQLPVAVTFPVHRNQHGDGVAEVGIDDRAAHAIGKLGCPGLVQFMAQFGPEEVGVFDMILQLDIADDNSGATGGKGFSFPHFGKLEDMAFKGLGHLLFHLFGGGTRVEGNYQPGAYRNRRIFRARHGEKRPEADENQQNRQDHRYRRIA